MRTLKRGHYITAFSAAVAALGATAYVVMGTQKPKVSVPPRRPIPAENTRPIVVPPAQMTAAQRGKAGSKTVIIYEVAIDEDGSRLQAKTITLPASATTREAQAVAAFKAETALSTKENPFPKDAHIKAVSFDEGGVAYVDFTRALHDNLHGDTNEALAVNSILATAGQFDGVRRVQILVEGARVESLGGTQTVSKPLPVPQAVAQAGVLGAGNRVAEGR